MSVRRRFFIVAKLFIRMVMDFRREYILMKKKGFTQAQKKMYQVHAKRAEQLFKTAVKHEGGLIKLCQYISTRRDIFPEPYLKILSPLQDSVPPVPFDKIEEVLQEDYGDYRKVFASIDEEPIASASLGQTHRAVLKEGKHVIIKVLKPGIEKVIDTDLAILFFVFRLLSYFKIFRERSDLQNLLDEFIRVTGDELNFEREVYIAGVFMEKMAGLSYVIIPEVFETFCSKHVIVMEYIDGDKISEKDSWKKRNNDEIVIARRLVEMYVEQFLFMPIIHFDPHPGNILITEYNNIALLDFGMAGCISDSIRAGIHSAFSAFIKKDYRAIVDIMDDLGFIRKGVDRYTLLPVVQFFCDEILSALKLDRESIHTVDLTPIKDELIEIIYSLPITLPENWAYIGKTVSTLVGLVIELFPDFNVYDELKPYAERFLGDNIDEIIYRTYRDTRTNISIMMGLPERIDRIVEKMECGQFTIKIDQTEMHEKIDEVKYYFVRLFSFGVCSFSAVASYAFYSFGKGEIAYLLLIASCLSLVVSLLYKKRSGREKMKKYF